MKQSSGHFNLTARVLHWLMAALILAMLFIGVTMVASLHWRSGRIGLRRPLGPAVLVLGGTGGAASAGRDLRAKGFRGPV